MKQDFMTSMEGVGIFPSIALIIFFVVFVVIVVRTLSLSKTETKEMGSLPLDADIEEKINE